MMDSAPPPEPEPEPLPPEPDEPAIVQIETTRQRQRVRQRRAGVMGAVEEGGKAVGSYISALGTSAGAAGAVADHRRRGVHPLCAGHRRRSTSARNCCSRSSTRRRTCAKSCSQCIVPPDERQAHQLPAALDPAIKNALGKE